MFADFVGPVETGRLTLRSEPALTESEILSLVVFGTVDGVNPAPAGAGGKGGATARAALSLGGGIAARGLTEAFDDLTGVRATARVDTTMPRNPRPEIQLHITPRVSIELARVIGTPPLYAPDKNLASIEWRVIRNWSLEATVGDRGTTRVDALWQKRY